MSAQEVPVLVAGGSLVGLTTSLLLAKHGVPHLLVERHRGTAIHPRAASFHQRTLEVFRSAGVQAEVEAAAAREFVQNGAIVAVDSLAGKELACFYRSFNDGVEGLSPTSRLFITQIGLEPVLREAAQAAGAEHLYATEMTGFAQDADGVTATLQPRDGGPAREVRTRYLIAADGAHSPVRNALGIAMAGRGAFADCATIYFKADIRDLIGDRNLSVVYVNRPDQLSFFRFAITGDAGFLAVFAAFDAEGRRQPVGDDLSPERCAELVRAALGVAPDFPVAIDNVQPWSATAATAERFREGRVFLAGDAAHLMPPTGGFGGNTGVADAHNLAWKLAMVLDGRAGPALLDSYDTERRPIAHLTVEQAYTRYVQRVDPSLPADDLAAPLADPAIELGAIYRSAGVIGAPGGDALVEDPHHPSGAPGTRIPHLALQRDGTSASTLDLPAAGFALLTASPAWADAAPAGLAPHRIAEAIAIQLGIGIEGALILRPDAVIGWRTDTLAAAPATTLATAMKQLLAR